MSFEKAIAQFYDDSPIVRLVRLQHPHIPEEVIHALFSTGFSMGSLHGFSEAKTALEITLLEHAKGGHAQH